jgi:hypothetical protein
MILSQEDINKLQRFMTEDCQDNIDYFIASYKRMRQTLIDMKTQLTELSRTGDLDL